MVAMNIQAVVSDMDGVLWSGDQALPGLHDFFVWLNERQMPYTLATNNQIRTPADYVRKLAKLGVTGVPEERILTSGRVTIEYIKAHYPSGAGVYVLGGDGLRQMVAEAGYIVTDVLDESIGSSVVVVGLDMSLTYEKLKRAALLVWGGADFIATNEDANLPSPEGFLPGGGSLVAALAVATERRPLAVMGKPHPLMYQSALAMLGLPPEQVLMIGDRLNTDIDGAQALGMKTALVLTGISTHAEALARPQPPDIIASDLPDLLRKLGA